VNPAEKSDWVLARARELGFDLCGIAPAADFLELERLDEWLGRGYAGQMRYLHDPRRASPALALPGARSLIVCALNYNTRHPYSVEQRALLAAANSLEPRGWISRYAWGDDYHLILGEKLDQLLANMRRQFAEPFAARAWVDTGPVHERLAAKYAGLGWIGKHTLLINEQFGSWLFLGVILTTLELVPSLARDSYPVSAAPGARLAGLTPPPDLCGQCTLCLDACPTGAILQPYLLDPRRCISYLTIELRDEIPDELQPKLGWHIFGCDICQDVCPWNRNAPVTSEPRFEPRILPRMAPSAASTQGDSAPIPHSPSGDARPASPTAPALSSEMGEGAPSSSHFSLFSPPLAQLASLSEEAFRHLFRASAIRRAKWQGLVRNAKIAARNFLQAIGKAAENG
jgi:epoxyqueuosine reductase